MFNDDEKKYWVLAFYRFAKISDPDAEVKAHKDFFSRFDVTSRIYISQEGINGQMSILGSQGPDYIDWIRSREPFQEMPIKIDYWHEHVFPRVAVKHRKKLVAIDTPVDVSLTGTHLSPEDWSCRLEEEEPRILVDVRNDYESQVGHFEGAELPPCNTFREFSDYADKLVERLEGQRIPVMMYCTGGIRCEIYSALLKQKGIEEVYQLDGGVINYGHRQGGKHWKGKLFVFDDRMAVPIGDEESETIGKCYHCSTANDDIYNCANMDCNEMFLSCPDCLEQQAGCCSAECTEAPRLRPYSDQNPHKPFRKHYHYFPSKAAPSR